MLQVSSGKQEEGKVYPEDVSKILNDMQLMKGKQENIDSKITTMKQYVCLPVCLSVFKSLLYYTVVANVCVCVCLYSVCLCV